MLLQRKSESRQAQELLSGVGCCIPLKKCGIIWTVWLNKSYNLLLSGMIFWYNILMKQAGNHSRTEKGVPYERNGFLWQGKTIKEEIYIQENHREK